MAQESDDVKDYNLRGPGSNQGQASILHSFESTNIWIIPQGPAAKPGGTLEEVGAACMAAFAYETDTGPQNPAQQKWEPKRGT